MAPHFDNTYARLPERFYRRVAPQPVREPSTLRVNDALCDHLGFDPAFLSTAQGAQVITGNRIMPGAEPIAMAYAGHQFGGWSPQLGDGRAHLLGEVLSADGARVDVQLKGSGRTPFSRRGDGRAPLGPVLREYIVSEAMHALGVPTSRTLAIARTGEDVRRDRVLPGAVLMRVASSHIRVGTFEYFLGRDDTDALSTLVDYALRRHAPDLAHSDQPALALFELTCQRQADLVAQWQLLGFIHGVMNTDNTLISGETIDYGPCAFMNAYDPATVYSSIDRYGRYAYDQQPGITHWNLKRLAHALAPLADDLDAFADVLARFPDLFHDAFTRGAAQKLGLARFEEDDWPLLVDLLDAMHQAQADFTLTFRKLADLADPAQPAHVDDDLFAWPAALAPWLARWRERVAHDAGAPSTRAAAMRAANPLFIPRNHRVEAAIQAARDGDLAPFHTLVEVTTRPYDLLRDQLAFARPPAPHERVKQTFCGT